MSVGLIYEGKITPTQKEWCVRAYPHTKCCECNWNQLGLEEQSRWEQKHYKKQGKTCSIQTHTSSKHRLQRYIHTGNPIGICEIVSIY